jgi:Protein of unknown function (DUF1350)
MMLWIVFLVSWYRDSAAFSWIHESPRKFSRVFLSSGASNDPVSELTNTLARLDQQWKIQQKFQPRSRWTTLFLPKVASKHSAQGDASDGGGIVGQDLCYLLEPPNNSVPSCLIVFTGGAGLGAYPQVAYNEFLIRLSNRLNAAIIAAPYQLSLDHFALAKETGDISRRAIVYCQDDLSRMYPDSIPTFSLSHSLGSKLSCIYVSATDQNFDGIGFISFNNFSFGATIGMAKQFAETISTNGGIDNPTSVMSSEAINSLFNFAEIAISAVGIDFSPSQSEMNRLIKLKYDVRHRIKTRFFSFDGDMLENSEDAWRACDCRPSVSGLTGSHLSPVYLKLDFDEIELPENAKELARDAINGFRSFSFGDDAELDGIVSDVCGWILGKEPKRKPVWVTKQPVLAAETQANKNL